MNSFEHAYSTPNSGSTRRYLTAIILIFAGLTLAIYSNAFFSPFVFDDLPFIYSDPNIRMTELSWEGIQKAALEGHPKHRWLPNISFALNYWAGQYQVPGYHAVNLFIHLFTGILLFFFFKTTLGANQNRDTQEGLLIAFFASLIWLVHPVNTQAVTYVCQRMTSLVALFYILAMLLYVKGRIAMRKSPLSQLKPALLFAGCALFGISAAISKENAGALPLFILLYEWFFFQDLKNILTPKRIAGVLIAAILFGAVAIAYLGENPLSRILASYARREFDLPQRVMTEFRVVVYYISLLFFPSSRRLTLEHDYPLSDGLADPATTGLALAAIIGAVAAAIFSAKKHRLLSFCILWFFGNLVIESSVIGIEIIFEHRNYLPAMMVSLFAVVLVFRHIKARPVAIGLLCGITAIASIWTFQRNAAWQTELSFYQDCVDKAPDKFRPRINLATALAFFGKTDAALAHLSMLLKKYPDSLTAYNTLGNIFVRQDRICEAIEAYLKGLRIHPNGRRSLSTDAASLHFNLAGLLLSRGLTDEAVYHYQESLRLNPNNAETHALLGRVLMQQENFAQAKTCFKKALYLDPKLETAAKNLNLLKKLKKNSDLDSKTQPLETISPAPENTDLYVMLGNFYQDQKKFKPAINAYRKALLINPEHAQARYNLSLCLGQRGQKIEVRRQKSGVRR
jgi:protein O-mannosyl-transferase